MESKRGKILLWALTAAILGGCVWALYATGFFEAAGSPEQMGAYIARCAPWSHLAYFGVQLVSVIVAPIPSNITAAAGARLDKLKADGRAKTGEEPAPPPALDAEPWVFLSAGQLAAWMLVFPPMGGAELSREGLMDRPLEAASMGGRLYQVFSGFSMETAAGAVSAVGDRMGWTLEELREENEVPIFAVVIPAARAAVENTRNKRVGLIGTSASIRSGAYEREIARLDPEIRVTARACPLFVPLVENGRFRPGDRVAELVVEEYLAPLRSAGIDTLVLGCTHYPLLLDKIRKYMPGGVRTVVQGNIVAESLADYLSRHPEMERRLLRGASVDYLTTEHPDKFSDLGSLFLSEPVSARHIDLN